MIIKKQFNKATFTMDMNLGYEVWKIRTGKSGSSHNINLTDHELIGKKIVYQNDGNEYIIESVHKHWYCGWYIVLLLERNKSHHLIMWENINCIYDDILIDIEENKMRYQIVD